jgi:hypothetical protein
VLSTEYRSFHDDFTAANRDISFRRDLNVGGCCETGRLEIEFAGGGRDEALPLLSRLTTSLVQLPLLHICIHAWHFRISMRGLPMMIEENTHVRLPIQLTYFQEHHDETLKIDWE